MAFVRTMTKKGRQYRALVENYREGHKVRQRILKWLGPVGGYKRQARKNTPAYDVQGAFMLGLPFRIVYEVFAGNKLKELQEKLARPEWIPRGQWDANFASKYLHHKYGLWVPSTPVGRVTKSDTGATAAFHVPYGWRQGQRERDLEEVLSLHREREQQRAQEATRASYKAEMKYMELRAVNQRQWSNYNAKIEADVERTHTGDKQHAIDNNLNAPQYGVFKDAPEPGPQEDTTKG